MIACDECDLWQHCACIGIQPHAVPDSYVCARCRSTTLDPFLEPVLANQTYKDSNGSLVIKLGENIKVARFARFTVGGGAEEAEEA